MTRPTSHRGRSNRYDDLLGLVGGAVCIGLSEIDVEWGLFWLATGVVLVVWSTVTFVRRKLRR